MATIRQVRRIFPLPLLAACDGAGGTVFEGTVDGVSVRGTGARAAAGGYCAASA